MNHKKRLKTLLIAGKYGLILFAFASCSNHELKPENKPNLRALSTGEVTLSVANNDFAFDLLREFQTEDTDNMMISPLSVSIALGMTLNGASETTRQSILNTIRFGDLQASEVNEGYRDLVGLLTSMDRTVEVNLANSVWYKKGLTVKSSFSKIIQDDYGTIRSLDFADPASVKTINDWVAGETHNKIKDLITGIDANCVMFLINAIYFKGQWSYQFDPGQTRPGSFYLEDGSVEQVPMMMSKEVRLGAYYGSKFALIDIPYGNKQFSMTILLPNTGRTVQEVNEVLSADSLSAWVSMADTSQVRLTIPKFKMEWKKDLRPNLMDMGMAMEDFPNMIEEPLPLAIDKVIHQSFIEVNEEGSEAAAATAVQIGYTSVPVIEEITVNRPFLFIIREKHSGVILFVGQLMHPGL